MEAVASDKDNDIKTSGTKPLPPGWRWVKLEEVCIQDRQIIEPCSDIALKLPYLSLEHVESCSGKILKQSTEAVEDEGTSTTFVFDERHLLYGKLRPYLNKVAMPDFPGRCTTELIPLLPDSGIHRGYLCWLLRRQETVNEAMRGKTGSRMPRANMEELLQLLIPLPPLLEQKRIAAILNEQIAQVEKARKSTEQQLEAAKALPFAYLRSVFNSPEAQKWPKRKLGEVCQIKGGKRLPQGTDFASSKTEFPYIRVLDFQDGTVNLDNLKYLDGETQKQIARYIISREDVYISIAGTIGIVGIVPTELDRANLTENAARLIIHDKSSLFRDFLVLFLRSPIGQEQIRLRTNLVGQPKLALERIATIEISLPSLSEQKRIAARLNEKMTFAEKLKKHIDEQLDTINKLPAALLKRAFNGV